jgi:hypothetical protein
MMFVYKSISLSAPETSNDSLKTMPTEELLRKDLQMPVVEIGIHRVAKQRWLMVGDKSPSLTMSAVSSAI